MPTHLQPAVGKQTERPKKNGQIAKARNIDENCFVSPAKLPVKKDKTVLKIAVNLQKRNEITVKRKAQISNME